MEENKTDFLGQLKFMGEDEDKNFYVQIEIVRSGPNRNGWDFQNMERLYKTFLGTPLLCAYLPHQIGDGHNFREATLPTGERILDFTGSTAERIVGAVSEDPEDIWTEERQDGVWVVAKGKIWRFYNRQLVDKLARQGSLAVSAEIETFQGYTTEDGIEVYTEWEGLGVTILHESVPPAVPGANIQAIKAMSEQFREMKFRAAAYQPEDTDDPEPGIDDDDDPDINDPDDVDDDQDDVDDDPDGKDEDDAQTPAQTAVVRKETTNNKGVKQSMRINRREAERLAPKFEGYHIVGLSDDGSRVLLMTDDFGLYSYKFNQELGEEVVPSLIQAVRSATVTCSVDGNEEHAVSADLDDIVKNLAAAHKDGQQTISNLNARIESLTADLDNLKAAMREHRKDMVLASIRATLAEIEEACDNCDNADISVASEAQDLESRCEDFIGMEMDGKFCGADRAKDELYRVFGEKQQKHLKRNRDKGKTQFAWDKDSGDNRGLDDGISGMLARINK